MLAGVSRASSKLRFHELDNPFHVVLFQPEIPQNTGNIGRLCAATGSRLHLVGKLGFDISEKAVRRAGLDYWSRLSMDTHDDLDVCLASIGATRVFMLSTRGFRPYWEMDFEPGSALVFGNESSGLPADVLERNPESVFAIPTLPFIRSLNLANSVAIVVYEALRSTGGLSSPFLQEGSV
jgi:tRNA (cytidine/uridine-2'-O-)-methyltransferase